jgi:hypothetical protein
VTSLVSLAFFTVPTLTGGVLFVLVRLSHHRRRIVHLRIYGGCSRRTCPTTTTFHTAPPRYVPERPEKPRVRW